MIFTHFHCDLYSHGDLDMSESLDRLTSLTEWLLDLEPLVLKSQLNIYQWNKENFQYSGKLNILIPASKTVKQAACSITKDEFSFTIPKSTFFSTEMRETVSLNNVECQSASMGSTGARIFILKSTINRPVLKAYRTLEFQTDNKDDAESWIQAFTNVGIYREVQGSTASLVGIGIEQASRQAKDNMKRRSIRDLRKMSSVDVLEDSHIQNQSSGMLKMIKSYFKIVDKEIRDIAPKYIMLTLGWLHILIHFKIQI